jgi:SUN domain-containing protein 1/2
MFIPFGAYSALKEKLFMNPASPELPPVVLPYVGEDRQQQQAVDMETLARYVLASAEFQQLLTAQVQKETQAAQKDTAQLQSAYVHQKHLHYTNVKLLTEQKAALSQLTHHLHQMQQKVNHLNSESKGDQAREKEWKLKFEKEKQTWREEAAAQLQMRDGDQVLMRKELRDIQSRLRLLQEQQAQILRRCCQQSAGPVAVDNEVIEQHVFRVLSGLLGATGGQFSGNPEDLRAWVSSMLVAQNDLDARLANLTFTLHLQTREAVQRSKEIIMASISEHIQNEFSKWQELQHQHDVKTSVSSSMGTWVTNSTGVAGLTDLQVRAIVDEALSKYDADKTGLVDYALESSGGSIISTRCTETYQAKTAKLSVLGIPLWYPSNNPRTVIQPGVHPGECWAFSGSQGFLVIQLSGLVQITAFSLEHIPRSLSPHGRIDSAPKDFTVWGLKELEDTEPVLLGKYTYQQNGTSLQNFSVQSGVDAFELVELRIESNHGNMEYTCLYRFRVHGVLLSK